MKICEKFNVFIIFSPYAKIFKTKNLMLNQKLQIILIIQRINAKVAKVIWYQEKKCD